jgi:methylase of polypeptide subunit release factors
MVARNRAARRKHRLPIPPSSLIFSATATRDVEWFLQSGEASARAFREALSDIGRPLETFEHALDFGCGSGRVLRQWAGLTKPVFYGTDYNRKAVNWVNKNLEFTTALDNNLDPPL